MFVSPHMYSEFKDSQIFKGSHPVARKSLEKERYWKCALCSF